MSKLYGIGIGPGDPKLITLKAKEVLSHIDYLFIPQSKAERESVAYNIVKQFINPQVEVIKLLLPMTRDQQLLQQAWQTGAQQMATYLKPGKEGAFITLGDCMLYSTYSYLLKEIIKLNPEMTVENIPGITSFAAVASALNIPLAEGEESLTIVPALKDFQHLQAVLSLHENVVFLKVAPNIDEIIAGLTQLKLLDRAVFVSKCGHPDQEIVYEVESLAGQKLEYLSLMLVKKGGIR